MTVKSKPEVFYKDSMWRDTWGGRHPAGWFFLDTYEKYVGGPYNTESRAQEAAKHSQRGQEEASSKPTETYACARRRPDGTFDVSDATPEYFKVEYAVRNMLERREEGPLDEHTLAIVRVLRYPASGEAGSIGYVGIEDVNELSSGELMYLLSSFMVLPHDDWVKDPSRYYECLRKPLGIRDLFLLNRSMDPNMYRPDYAFLERDKRAHRAHLPEFLRNIGCYADELGMDVEATFADALKVCLADIARSEDKGGYHDCD